MCSGGGDVQTELLWSESELCAGMLSYLTFSLSVSAILHNSLRATKKQSVVSETDTMSAGGERESGDLVPIADGVILCLGWLLPVGRENSQRGDCLKLGLLVD